MNELFLLTVGERSCYRCFQVVYEQDILIDSFKVGYEQDILIGSWCAFMLSMF